MGGTVGGARQGGGGLEAFRSWLGVEAEGTPEILSGSFAAATLHADLLARLSPTRVVHVEYQRVTTVDVWARMTGYRAQIMTHHGDSHVTQIVLVVGDGRIRSRDDPETGFALGLRTAYLREQDPARFLASPALAPLAVLARGDTEAVSTAVPSITSGGRAG